jgi:AcrR family transcriptional regulator
MSVARVASCAGVSRRTFYEVFEDREDCFIALFDDALARAIGVAREASLDPVFAVGRDGWRGRVRAGLSALLGFVEDEPELGSLLVVGALGGGPKVLERRARAIETVIAIVDEGRVEVKAASGPPPLTAEGVVGAVLSVIHARLLEQAAPAGTTSSVNGSSRARARGAPASLIGLLNPLMGMIVLPYLGRAAAAKELARPVPKISRASRASRRTPRPSSGDPLEGIDMRLTYRTLRVLSAIAELGGPGHGPSNRQIAQAADVHDQGQISKLLARLERLGLIHNSGAGQPRGEPNAWGLTDRGTEVEGALRL